MVGIVHEAHFHNKLHVDHHLSLLNFVQVLHPSYNGKFFLFQNLEIYTFPIRVFLSFSLGFLTNSIHLSSQAPNSIKFFCACLKDGILAPPIQSGSEN